MFSMMKSICGESFVEIPYHLLKLLAFFKIFLAYFEVSVLKYFSSETTESILMTLCMIVP